MQTESSFLIRFQQAMNERNIKQSDLAERTGLGKSAISQYATGKYEPKQRALHLLAEVLDVSEMWLMGYDVPMERGISEEDMQKKAPEFPVGAKGAQAAFYDGAFDGLDEDDMDMLRQMANHLRAKRAKEDGIHDRT